MICCTSMANILDIAHSLSSFYKHIISETGFFRHQVANWGGPYSVARN